MTNIAFNPIPEQQGRQPYKRALEDGLLRHLMAQKRKIILAPITDHVDAAIKGHLSRRLPFKFPENLT